MTLAVLLAAISKSAPAQVPEFGLSRDTVLLDEKISITVTGLPPNLVVTLHLENADDEGRSASNATFLSDQAGRIDLTRMAPIAGSYAGVDPMGLFWSTQLDTNEHRLAWSQTAAGSAVPEAWELRAESGGLTIATDTVWRLAAKSGVRVTPLRERGLVGTFYQAQGATPKPGMIVLSGATGGLKSVAESPGGLASRGYSVLSLAYFSSQGLPKQLAEIRLEYFKTAIDWLRSQPSVDPERIGLLGTSRGGEVALLLGSIYPEIKAVVAYVPSHVVWAGCCDSVAQTRPPWTLGGKPIPHMPPTPEIRIAVRSLGPDTPVRRTPVFERRLQDTMSVRRAAIAVERINGPVLLISGRDDQVWPSTVMAEEIIRRLRNQGFKHAFHHLAYNGAGHAIGRPYTSTMDINRERHPLTKRLWDFGGTPEGTARASEDSWSKLLEFLEKHFRSSGQN
jgi:dienelactone hydrolase